MTATDDVTESAGRGIALTLMLRHLFTIATNQLGTGNDGLLAMRADIERQIDAAPRSDPTKNAALNEIQRAARGMVREVFEPITEDPRGPGSDS